MTKADYGPDFMRAEDLIQGGKWCEMTYTIQLMHLPNTLQTADKKLIDKPVLQFEETGKQFVLGTTNNRLLKYATGATTQSQLIGQKITIYPAVGNWFGQRNVTTKRIKVPEGRERPFIKPSDLGTDITGRTFQMQQAAPPSEPQPSSGPGIEEQQQIQAQERQEGSNELP